MKKFVTLLLLLLPIISFAQIDLAQDEPHITWRQIEDQNFKVVFPDYAENSAHYVLNLLNYYKPIVDKTYSQNSRKLTVVIRANMSEPNGFVTLAPRRSEWFLSRSSSPLVGSLEWLQALAVHEYRHVAQFDYLKRSNNQLAYIIGGEELLGTVLAISMPNWYFEGDAVWTETAYTNAGRGRSPRFSARLKALLLTDQVPSLDQIIAGDYTKPLPNIYVFGYFLIAKGVNDYGKDFWKKVAARSSDSSLNPYALYRSFREITGKDFDTFYNEMMGELQASWKENYSIPTEDTEYIEYAYPIYDRENLYYLKKDIKSFWQIFEKKAGSTKSESLSELAVSPSLQRIDVKNNKLLYIQNLPDKRYGYKSYSDLFMMDLKTKNQKRITHKKRLTHPKFDDGGEYFLAIEFTKKNNWNINLYKKDGERFKTFKGTPKRQFVEAVWGNKSDLFAIALAPDGKKQIVRIDFYQNKNEIIELTYPTRNNIYSLSFNENKLYFEGDDKGVVNIFSIDPRTLSLSKCTDVAIAASNPYAYKDRLIYVVKNGYGSELREQYLDCKALTNDYIEKPDQYLGKSPSDNYQKSLPVDIQNFEKLYEKDKRVTDYPEYKSNLVPHSWSILGGTGLSVSARSTNILNSLDLFAATGVDGNEGGNYAALNLSYRKYYPIISLGLRFSERTNKFGEDEDDEVISWSENTYSAAVSLPYIFQKNLYYGFNLLTGFAEHITIGDSQGEVDYGIDNKSLTGTGFIYQFSNKKTILPTQLAPEYGVDLTYLYEDVRSADNSELDSYFGSLDMNFYLPGFEQLHSTHISLSGEYRPEDELKYKVQDKYFPVIGYNFSRGYQYEYTPEFGKATFEYSLPLAYPNYDLWHFAFFKRINGRYFFDHTKVNLDGVDRNLNSSGIELEFDTFFFRKVEATIGVRYIGILKDDTQVTEFYISI